MSGDYFTASVNGNYVTGMQLNANEIKELATILTFDLVQGQADKLRDVGEHGRADVLWNLNHKLVNQYDDLQKLNAYTEGE